MAVLMNSLYSATQNAGKLYVPVSSSALIYSHFDHVSGVKAKNGQNGISISKIRILNTLIDHLSSLQSKPTFDSKKLISSENIDSLIENYQTQIKQIVTASQTAPYGLAGKLPESGILFSFDA